MSATAMSALAAAPGAHAVDWTGYIRGGPAATNVHGESRQCYGLSGPALKYRLGNECDSYGEFQLSQAMKADGVDFNAVLMTHYYSPATEPNQSNNSSDTNGIDQAYVEMKGVDFAPQTLFWMGVRRDRTDVHIVDTFFTNLSGVGAGFKNVDLGGVGKFGFYGYKTDTRDLPGTATNGGARLHADFYDLVTNPDGKVRLIATYSHGDSQGGIKGTSGEGLSLEHVQDKFLGGANHLWLQYAQGSTGLNQSFGTLTAPSSSKSYRAVESMTWQVGAFGGQALAMYQHDKTELTSVNSSTIGGRMSYAATKNLKFLAEVGYSQKKPSGQAAQNLTKVTVGPALSTGPDFWKRPELRLYVTHANFNRAAANDPSNGLPAGETSGPSYGAQVEIWF
jgi:maltoporin